MQICIVQKWLDIRGEKKEVEGVRDRKEELI